MAIIPCDLSLITYVFQIDSIFDIHISQGSVATHLRRGGIFKHDFVANFLQSTSVIFFENRLIFGEVMGKSLVSCFLTHSVQSKLWDIEVHTGAPPATVAEI